MIAFELNDKLPEVSDKSSYRHIDWKNASVDAPAITSLLQRMRRQGTMLDDVIIHTKMRFIPDLVKGQAALPEEKRLPGYADYVENWTYGLPDGRINSVFR
jgi:hypothetical protein